MKNGLWAIHAFPQAHAVEELRNRNALEGPRLQQMPSDFRGELGRDVFRQPRLIE